jgi:hypothetical protein
MEPLSSINDLAGVLIQQYSGDLDETLEMVLQGELVEAKEKGLKGVKGFVYNNSNSKKDKYDLMDISAETVSEIADYMQSIGAKHGKNQFKGMLYFDESKK